MKTKLDFVTNSSSVSVVMWGVYLEDLDSLKANEEIMKKIKAIAEKKGITEEDIDDGFWEAFQYMAEDAGLETNSGECGDAMYIGKSPFDIAENQTPRDFKKNVEEKLKSIGIDEKVSAIIESWRDG